MQVSRLATLALLAVCAISASGCRTAGVNDLARPDPVLSPKTADAAEILAEHNRNAERIQTLMAKPDLTVTVYERSTTGRLPDRPSSYALTAYLTMEQPRNFKLMLRHPARTMGEIGSNDDEYWFWFKEKKIYYCNYNEAEANRQAAAMQPDWIKEAMGLRVIPESEAAQIKVTPGKQAGTLVLTHRPHRAGGETYTRVTIVDQATHKILEHQLRSGDQKTILARAEVPEGYLEVPDSSATAGDETVSIPKRLKLVWIQEGLDLDVTFRPDAKVNVPIRAADREALFTEPKEKGFARINLAERAQGAAGPTTIRETFPAPPSGSGVRLGAPAPIGDDAAQRDNRTRGNSVGLGGAEPTVPSLADEIVGARFPTAPE